MYHARMFGMIIIDSAGWGDRIRPIEHSEWNGLTTADLIFPNFLFIMGLAIPLAISGDL